MPHQYCQPFRIILADAFNRAKRLVVRQSSAAFASLNQRLESWQQMSAIFPLEPRLIFPFDYTVLPNRSLRHVSVPYERHIDTGAPCLRHSLRLPVGFNPGARLCQPHSTGWPNPISRPYHRQTLDPRPTGFQYHHNGTGSETDYLRHRLRAGSRLQRTIRAQQHVV